MRQPKNRGCGKSARQKISSKTPKEDLGKRGLDPKDKAALGKYHEFRRTRSQCAIDERRPGVSTWLHLCEGRRGRQKRLSHAKPPSPPAGVSGFGVVRSTTDAPHGVERARFSQMFGASGKTVLFHGRVVCEGVEKMLAKTRSSRKRYQIGLSRSSEDINDSTARLPWKRRAFSAIIHY